MAEKEATTQEEDSEDVANASESEEEKKEETDEDKSEDESEDESEKGEGDYEPDKPRQSVADHVAERRGEKIKKLQTQSDDKDEEEEETRPKPEAVQDAVKEVLAPYLDSMATHADDTEINSFLSDSKNADFKKHEARVRKDVKVYPKVPLIVLFRAHAYADLIVQQATEAAKEKSKKGKVTGTSKREPVSGLPDFGKMSDKDFETYKNKILSGKKVKLEQ